MPTLKNNLVLKKLGLHYLKKKSYLTYLNHIGMAKAQAFKRRSWGRTDLGHGPSG